MGQQLFCIPAFCRGEWLRKRSDGTRLSFLLSSWTISFSMLPRARTWHCRASHAAREGIPFAARQAFKFPESDTSGNSCCSRIVLFNRGFALQSAGNSLVFVDICSFRIHFMERGF